MGKKHASQYANFGWLPTSPILLNNISKVFVQKLRVFTELSEKTSAK
jgi:hypothetical protein